MTAFESYLMENGYRKFAFNTNTFKWEETNKDNISSIFNLDYRYIHKSSPLIKLIDSGVSAMDIDNSLRKDEIVFGLSEYGKPPTLTHPRPNIKVKRLCSEGEIYTSDQRIDDNMNVVLQKIPFEQILKAMFDKSITLQIDLT